MVMDAQFVVVVVVVVVVLYEEDEYIRKYSR